MERSEKIDARIESAQEHGIDLTLLYERLSWTPTERLEKHFQLLEFANKLRKAGEKHRGRSQGRGSSKGTS
jgi:hypothetical protein